MGQPATGYPQLFEGWRGSTESGCPIAKDEVQTRRIVIPSGVGFASLSLLRTYGRELIFSRLGKP